MNAGSPFAAISTAYRASRTRRLYGRSLRALAALDDPAQRAARLELMAGCLDYLAALQPCHQDAPGRCEAADLLRHVAATERGYVLIDADDAPGEHYVSWLRLATTRDHRDRAAALADLRDDLQANGLAADVLSAVAETGTAAAALTPAGRP